jgi:hypothetical protein
MNYRANVFLLYCLLAIPFVSHSQNAYMGEIDSLKKVLKAQREDTNKVNSLKILSDELRTVGGYDSSRLFILSLV